MVDRDVTPRADILRSPLGRARGLGAARSGAHDWWAQRLTSIALVPLSFWFIAAAIRFSGSARGALVGWLSSPWQIALMTALIAATFYHLSLGLQVVLEDYVHHEPTKLVTIIVQKAACGLLAIVCLVATLKIGLRP